jgi:hypothetical protein
MNRPPPPRIAAICLLLGVAAVASARADSLELVNGDHFRGTVVSVTQSNIEFQSETLGRVTLARSKVAHINLGETAVPKPSTNGVASQAGPSLILQGKQNLSPAGAATTQPDAVLQQIRQEGIDPALVSEVKQRVLGQGNPVAAQKFDELMGGLMSGSLSVGDIRAQAQESIKQIKDAKQQLGPEAGDLFDGYLAILESFVAETATNSTLTPAASSPAPASATAAAASQK